MYADKGYSAYLNLKLSSWAHKIPYYFASACKSYLKYLKIPKYLKYLKIRAWKATPHNHFVCNWRYKNISKAFLIKTEIPLCIFKIWQIGQKDVIIIPLSRTSHSGCCLSNAHSWDINMIWNICITLVDWKPDIYTSPYAYISYSSEVFPWSLLQTPF